MANNYGVANTVFKPFSFEEMLKPALMATESHEKREEELNTLLEDAATKAFNFMDQDKAEKAIYEVLTDRIKRAADSLATTGLSSVLQKDISNLNKEYRSKMLPIQQQLAKRAELVAEQKKALLDNPNLIFSTDYSKANLRDITSSSTYSIVDPEKYKEEVAKEFSNITNNIVKDAVSTTKIKGTNTYNVLNQVGYTPEEFEEAFTGNNGNPDLNSPIYQFYKERKDAIYARKDIDNSTKQKLERTLYNTMKNNAGKSVMSTATAPTTSSNNNRTPKQILHHYNHNELDKINRAYYTLGNQVIEYEVLGFEKNNDGTYKKDKSGNYIPILGNKIKEAKPDKRVIRRDVKNIYDNMGRITSKETTITYADGTTSVETTPVDNQNPRGNSNMWEYTNGD